ncbi:IQUB [Symbiodinium microadriaticum]|nr:IQUB [Symbiodinium microadriaticum]
MGLSSSRCAPTCFDGEHEFNLNDSRFIDVAFPPTPSSLGEAKPGKLFITQEQREKTRWVRVPELLHFNQQITAAEFSQKQQSELTWTVEEEEGRGAAEAEAPPVAPEGAVQEAPEEAAPQESAPAAPTGQGPGEAAIDLVILPEGYGQTKQVDIDRPVGKIRGDLEAELSIPDKSLYLMNLSGAVEFKQVLPDEKTLRDLGLKPGDRAGIELRINYYQEQPAEEYVMPDMLDLKVVNEHGEERMVSVHVQRPVMEKPYLGGFRNKATDSMYHHAVSQTAPVQKKDVHTLRFHREAQTYEYRTRSTQCKRDNGTQMDKVGLYIDSRGDKTMEPRRPYFSSADKAALLLERCVMIQCHARGMLARRRTRQLRQMRQERHELARKEAERRQLEADLRHKREVERRMHPRTFEDFSVLYKELEAWRVNEAARIQNSGFDEATRRAAQHELLRKETKLLQTIDKLKIQAHTSNRDAKIKSKLESMSQPKVWAQGDGETTTVHTPFTTRAKELMDLYSGLRLPLLTVDERLDVLLHVKWTVKEFDCNLTREMVDLIDREADMLNRGRPEKSFVGLRKRLANLFLQFIETPEFNPEAMKFQKVSREFYDQTGTHPLSTVPIKALGMSSSDLAQGSLGNCWLVATIAALARRPGAVRRLFVEADPPAGRFTVQLFDMASGRWELVEVDDFVPCTMEDDWSDVPYEEQADGTRVYNYKDVYTESGAKRLRKKWVPLFGRPNGRQVWALILEKASAFCESLVSIFEFYGFSGPVLTVGFAFFTRRPPVAATGFILPKLHMGYMRAGLECC